LIEPAPPANLVGEGGLSGQQLGFFQALAEQDGRVAGWYLGARLTLSSTRNPERLQQAAHSLRELMDKLLPVLGLPAEAEGGRLGDRFAAMTARWEAAKEQSRCQSDGVERRDRRGGTTRATSEQLDPTRRMAIAQEGQLTEHFSRAIEQLGSPQDNLNVWLGGIYGPEWIIRARRATDEPSPASASETSAGMSPGQQDPPAAPGSSALHPLGQTPALRPDPDIQAAMTMVGRLVAHEEDMAASVDRLQLFDTDPARSLPSQRRPVSRAAPRRPPTRGARCATRTGAVRSWCTRSSSAT
jgi:hypothetical protein